MNEEWTVGYDEGYQAGWNAAMDAKPARGWVGLTDEEIEEINVSLTGRRDLSRMFARAIEAAHGIGEKK